MNLVVYKAFLALKVIAKLLHEFFLLVYCKVIAPVKHGNLHFRTLSVASVFLRIRKNAFMQVKKGI